MKINTIQEFIDYYIKVRIRTLRVIKQIPPDKMEWTYKEGKFTIGDIIRHIAGIERYMFAENVSQRPSSYPGHDIGLSANHKHVVDYMNELHEESMQIFKSLSDEDLMKKCTTPAGVPISTWKWLRAMLEHEIHHRGQIFTYLSMFGISSPPLYGLTSEEVLERSV